MFASDSLHLSPFWIKALINLIRYATDIIIFCSNVLVYTSILVDPAFPPHVASKSVFQNLVPRNSCL